MWMMGVNVDVISDSGSSCCKSVGTDLSMLDIDDFISEISQLKKEVALLEEKLRERGDQLKREELEKVSCPSSVCVTDGTSRESQYSVWSSRDQPSPQRLVDKLSKERSRDTQDSELSLTLLCYTDSNPTDAQESVCESHQAFQDGSGLSLHGSTDQTSTQSLGSVRNGEEQQILQTPVMMCSVKLVDPEDMRAEIKAEGEQYYEDDYFIPSDENSSSASDGETDSTSAQRLTAQSHSCITSETSVTSQGHTKPKLFTCGACGSRFSTVQEKRHHAKVHRVKKDFHCDQCGKVYSSYSSSYMKVHMKMHSEKSFHCSVCGKFFHTKGNLVVHERIHTGEKPYRCPHCEKTFSYSSSLKTHVRLHTNERPYQCSHCERNFTQSSNLIAHQKIHSEEKPHQCSHCSKCYRRKSELKSHERIHSGEKPYLCSHCGKRFSSRATFRIHLRVHTGERPYHCTVCGKSFSQHISCVMHQRIHTGEKPYYCSTCGKRFSRQSDFVKHQRIHTREKHKKRDPGHASPNCNMKKWL